ncbi:MAG: hypothetical protein IPK39_23675 [Sulfuritalea sp.]|nr:hypothetical protein [Sulfuritalea sp.]
MTLQQFLQILRVRYKLALIVFVIAAAIGTTVTLLLPKEYQATTSLVVDVKADPIAGMLMPSLGSPGLHDNTGRNHSKRPGGDQGGAVAPA